MPQISPDAARILYDAPWSRLLPYRTLMLCLWLSASEKAPEELSTVCAMVLVFLYERAVFSKLNILVHFLIVERSVLPEP